MSVTSIGGVKTLLQKEDVVAHVETSSSNVHEIKVQDKIYAFSDEMIAKYPKLLDPSLRYSINFDSVLPIIYDYPVSCLDPKLLDENHEKQIFLSNCEFLGIKLEDSVIIHLSKTLKDEITECSEYVQKKAGKKGKEKLRFINLREVQEFASEQEVAFSEHGSDVKPLDIIRMLELGGKCIDTLVLHDFKSKNVVLPFIKAFMSKFLGE